MKTRVQKWGNSLALRIPKTFALETGLEPDTEVEITLVNGQLVIVPSSPIYTLESLLAGITDRNSHAEVDMGGKIGSEEW
ncbi:MAG: AbrB/MazE/SpoVT family DNA-binding domain-containing protein [Anaerolineae bacterium]|nr:AbrB/MazE/SpoVT family DNA-binding domain-containing protein [Anaerolineae bacterium]